MDIERVTFFHISLIKSVLLRMDFSVVNRKWDENSLESPNDSTGTIRTIQRGTTHLYSIYPSPFVLILHEKEARERCSTSGRKSAQSLRQSVNSGFNLTARLLLIAAFFIRG